MAETLLRLVIGAGQRKALSNPASQARASTIKGGRAGQSPVCQEEASNSVCRGHSGRLADLYNPRLLVDKSLETVPPISATVRTRPHNTALLAGPLRNQPSPLRSPLQFRLSSLKVFSRFWNFPPQPLDQSLNY